MEPSNRVDYPVDRRTLRGLSEFFWWRLSVGRAAFMIGFPLVVVGFAVYITATQVASWGGWAEWWAGASLFLRLAPLIFVACALAILALPTLFARRVARMPGAFERPTLEWNAKRVRYATEAIVYDVAWPSVGDIQHWRGATYVVVGKGPNASLLFAVPDEAFESPRAAEEWRAATTAAWQAAKAAGSTKTETGPAPS